MFRLPEKMTVWNAVNSDGAGRLTYSAPYHYKCRIAYTQTKFTDKMGDDKISSAVAYSRGAELGVDSIVLLGSYSDAVSPPDTANDVRARTMTPSGPGDLKKVWFT